MKRIFSAAISVLLVAAMVVSMIPSVFAAGGTSIESAEIDNEIKYYLDFDGEAVNEGTVNTTVTENGTVTYADGFVGKGAVLDNGYISVKSFAPGNDSFTVAFWVKTTGAMNTTEGDADPCILSSSNWHAGKNPGLTFAYRSDYKGIRFNIADGTTRDYIDAGFTSGAGEGWTHVIATVDRENDQLRFVYNFEIGFSNTIQSALQNSSITTSYPLNIGHDGSATYTNKLTNLMVDDLVIYDGVLSDDEIIELATHYGVGNELTGASVALGESIDVNYFAKLLADKDDVQVRFTFGDNTYIADAQTTGIAGQYKFVFEGLAPQCMGDNIKAELIVNGKIVATKNEYSVLQNLNNVKNDKNAELVEALLHYGAAAQKYADYKTDVLVNEGLEAPVYDTIVNEDRVIGEATVEGASFSAAGVHHANANKLYAKVEVTTADVSMLTVTIDGVEAELVELADGEYIAYSDDIVVTDFDEIYTFELTDGTNTQTLTYSVNAYCAVKQATENEKTAELARAMYAYGAAAEAYADANGDYKYVAIIGVDGAGAYFAQTSTPTLDEIFEDGAITYTCKAATPSMSAQGWANILHGVTPAYHGCTNTNTESNPYPSDSQYPSIFRMIREQDENAVLASFVNWDNINVGIIENGFGVTKVATNYKPGGDAELTNKICDYLEDNNPTLLFVQFDEVDYAGENKGGFGKAAHLAQITTTDGYIKRIYEAYEAKGILEDTLFIVTADHGGINSTHGGSSDAEMNVMFAAAGKTVLPGSQIGAMDLCDTAAIVIDALGYEAPTYWSASIPNGLFDGDDEELAIDNEIKYYIDFDGEAVNEGTVDTTVTEHGTIAYVDGYLGQGAELDNGYFSIDNYVPADIGSFTVAFWLNAGTINGDPCLISNKNWSSGRNNGIALVIENSQLTFNAGNGGSSQKRIDYKSSLPYKNDWVHVIATYDIENNQAIIRYNFGEANGTYHNKEYALTADLATGMPLNIGQDGTGKYGNSVNAVIDELVIYQGVLTENEIYALSLYYASTEEEVEEIDNEIKYYLDFDGEAVKEGSVATTVSKSGTVSYAEGRLGQGVVLDNGYLSINSFAPGKDSFTVAFWVKTNGSMNTTAGDADPCIISSSSWHSGTSTGLTFAYRNDYKGIRFNIADGTTRDYIDAPFASGVGEGWTHVIAMVDRTNNTIRMIYNFEQGFSNTIQSALQNSSLTSSYALNIGHDGSGTYTNKLTNLMIDELIIFDGILTSSEVELLAELYAE